MTLPTLNAQLATATTAAQQADANATAANMDLAAKQNAASMADAALATAIKTAAAAVDAQAKAHLAMGAAQAAVAAMQPVDLAPLLKAAKPGDVIAPGAAGYVLNESLDFKTANVTVDLNNAPLTCTPSAGASSSIVVHAASFHARRWNVLKAAVLFRVYAPDFLLSNSTVDNCQSAINSDENGVRMGVTGNHFGKNFTAVPVYVTTDDAFVDSNVFDGSVAEYASRFDFGSNGHKPQRATVTNNTLANNGNAFGKDTAGFRAIDDLIFRGNKVSGCIRFGGVAGAGVPPISSPTQINGNALVDGNHFTAIIPGGAAVRVYQGATVTITGNDFACDGATTCISEDITSVVSYGSNRQLHAAGVTVKPILGASSGGVHTDLGGNVAVVV